MALAVGTRLGPYEVAGPLGAGGMGEVYRARDIRLGREVAIKMLPAQLASDPVLRERLEREAKAISQLSHPNICTLHDIGQQDGVDFLVMELLEGESLEQRLLRGPLPPDQVLKIGIQIADALNKAHRRGIVHRDLKPGNIFLTKAGAKLLDFGLARANTQVPVATALTELTADSKLTAEGSLVGTFQYMAPEQLEGHNADARTDIFALGSVLYEMATGKAAFSGRTRASLIASILTAEPPSIVSLQPLSPAALDRVVRTCLAKDPDDRFQTAHDLKLQLAWIAEGSSQAGVPATRRRSRERIAWIAAMLLIIAAALAYAYWPTTSAPAPLWRSYLLPPEKHAFGTPILAGGQVAVSPDGRMVTYVLMGPDGQLLWLQSLDSSKPVPLMGTDGASYPFWSPDSRTIGFFAGGKLKRIDARGGPVQTICPATDGRGGSWNSEGTIIFSPEPSGALAAVSAGGGTPRPLSKLDLARYETSHRWPWFLPDGRHFLFTARAFSEDHAIYIGSLDSLEHKLLLPVSSNAIYVPPGYVLYIREGSLMGQRFDARRLQLEGEAFPVAENVRFSGNYSLGTFSASGNGVLVYMHGQVSQANWQTNWYDRSGKTAGDPVVNANGPSLSPDGKTMAFQSGSPSGGEITVWLLDIVRQVKTRFSFLKPLSFATVWSPDGKQIAFGTWIAPGVNGGIYIKPSDGSSPERLLYEGQVWPDSWSRDGRYILMHNVGSDGLPQLWALPMQGDSKPFPVVQAPSHHVNWGDFSPDGKWITYESDESGTSQVYVAPFPGPGGRWQVSTDGGHQPLWRGNEIFFLNSGKVWATDVQEQVSGVRLGQAHVLFSAPYQGNPGHWYDVSRDGKRFVINTSTQPQEAGEPLNLVVNWTAEPTMR